MRGPLTGPTSFVPLEWEEFFAGLSPSARSEAAVKVCRALASESQLASPVIDLVIDALETGRSDPHLHEQVQAAIDQAEAEYDALVGDDEAKLACTEPAVEAAYTRARVAWALKFALEGKLQDMAYESWSVLNDQNYIRELVGMPLVSEESADSPRTKWWQFWARWNR